MSTTADPGGGLQVDVRVARRDFGLAVELEVAPGETVAIVGPNGAGKSTLVRAITGLTPVTGGVIRLAGRVLDEPAAGRFVAPHQRSIGTAFQEPLLFPHLTVRGNVGFRVADRKARGAEADAWLERVGLAGFGGRRVRGLSGGEARRVSIARALIGAPDLVILDEPFAGLDAQAVVGVRRMLVDQVADHPAARLLITHDPLDAQVLADRMVVIEGGLVTQRGTPEQIRRRPTTRYVADLVGLNLVHGVADQGLVRLTPGELSLTIADRSVSGPVTVTIAPHALALHRERPAGSPRNSWPAVVGGVHRLGDVMRVQLDTPVPLVADVTPAAVAELTIEPGRQLWVAVKATSLDPHPRDL